MQIQYQSGLTAGKEFTVAAASNHRGHHGDAIWREAKGVPKLLHEGFAVGEDCNCAGSEAPYAYAHVCGHCLY